MTSSSSKETEIDRSSRSWSIVLQSLRELPVCGVPFIARIRSGIRDLDGYTDFFGDEEHALNFIAGFVVVESVKNDSDEKMRSIGVEKRFFLAREGKKLLIEGRFVPRDGGGSVSFGLTARRIGKDRFYITNG